MNRIPGKKIFLAFSVALALGAVLGSEYYKLAKENSILKGELVLRTQELVSVKDNFKEREQMLEQEIARVIYERDTLARDLANEKSRVDSVAAQVKNITNDVNTLVKLSRTDPQLLQKYSKVYFLNEHYVPQRLAPLDARYAHDPKKELLIHADVAPFLHILLNVAESSGVDLKIISAYRSFGTQAELKSSYTVIYGSGANRFSADQGYSEHQLGTAVDFTTSKTGSNFSAFEKTPAYEWLSQNAHNYGFVLSYPPGNQYYQFEPWHWRFVGRTLARKLHEEGKYFYDLEQRYIDEYLVSLFD